MPSLDSIETTDTPKISPAECPGELAEASSGWLRATVLIAAVWTLGMALQVHEGFFTPKSVRFLAAAVALMLTAVCVPLGSRRWKIVCDLAFVTALGVQLYFLATEYAGTLGVTDPASERRQIWNTFPRPDTAFLNPPYFRWGLLVVGVAAAALFARRAWIARAAFITALVVHLAMGLGFVRQTAPPFSDVYLIQQKGAAALLKGDNPFSITVPNLFDVKGPDWPIDKDGNLAWGYNYPPLTLFLLLPSYLLTGDSRYAHVFAFTIAAAFIGFISSGRHSKLAALLLLFSPRAFMMLELGNTEPFMMMFFAGTAFAAVRRRPETPVLFGLCVAAKQYSVFLAPLGLLLVSPPVTWKRAIRFFVIAIIAAAIVTLPLVLVDWSEARRSLFESQARYHPLSPYHLSMPAWVFNNYPRETALRLVPLAFILAGAVSLFAAFRLDKTPANFCLSAATAYMLFFVFNKQAFSHYYCFEICMMCCAIATSLAVPARPPEAGLPLSNAV